MIQIIEVYSKSVYGQELVYPHNEQAKLFADLIGKKTFNRIDLARIESIGFDVKNMSFVAKQF